MDAIRYDAQGFKPGSQIAHEGGWSADIEIAAWRHVEFLKHLHIEATRPVKSNIQPVLAIGRAITDATVAVGKGIEQSTLLLGKGMFPAITSTVEPPDFSRRCFGSQHMKHREHRRHTDP